MAEFQEVIKHALRMEESYSSANHITLDVYEDGMTTSESVPAVPLAKFESIVMEWAKANPEPRYPTFLEHVHSVFPNCMDDEICVEFLYGELINFLLVAMALLINVRYVGIVSCRRNWRKNLASSLLILQSQIVPVISRNAMIRHGSMKLIKICKGVNFNDLSYCMCGYE